MYFTASGSRCSYVIALDSKARLVLPLEIREALGIETNGKILISVSAVQNGNVSICLVKAKDSDLANGRKFSRNCAYLKADEGGKND